MKVLGCYLAQIEVCFLGNDSDLAVMRLMADCLDLMLMHLGWAVCCAAMKDFGMCLMWV